MSLHLRPCFSIKALQRFSCDVKTQYTLALSTVASENTINDYRSNRSVPTATSNKPRRKVIVEFSSPNIAKPFHVGHLRSTIIGNFIANLNAYLSNDVVRINYLGDWGTQFGLLKLGVDMSGYTEEMIKENPVQLLYQAYVIANKKAEVDPNISIRAREIFQQLEEGSLADLEKWQTFRTYTIDELRRVYERLGVVFDEYNWESMYGAKDISTVLSALDTKGLLKRDEDGKQVVEINNKRSAVVVKSDGTTLYLTRDIAAAMDRFAKHNFNKMLYVVDNAQSEHFTALFEILKKMDLPWADRLVHIKFGRIRGMSTRKGNVVFLKDILDETKNIMYKKQLDSPTTKIKLSNVSEGTADILGVSAVIVNDLKQRRQRDYEFDWNRALQIQGDTGVQLQYTHCRLWSLEQNCGMTAATEPDSTFLQELPAVALSQHVLSFRQALEKSHQELEACILVNYLFQLCNLINKAFKVLPVKNQDERVGSQRLLLFHTSRLVLNQGMRILGLQPLHEM